MPTPDRPAILSMGIVINDAGPLIALARIGLLDLLRQVFGAVVLTAVVAAEIGIDVTNSSRASRWLTPQTARESSNKRIASGWLGWSQRETATITFTSGVMAATGHRPHSAARSCGPSPPPRR